MSELVSQDLGKYAHVSVKLEGGAISASVAVPLSALIDEAAAKIKGAIPGSIDDAVVDLIVAALKAALVK